MYNNKRFKLKPSKNSIISYVIPPIINRKSNYTTHAQKYKKQIIIKLKIKEICLLLQHESNFIIGKIFMYIIFFFKKCSRSIFKG